MITFVYRSRDVGFQARRLVAACEEVGLEVEARHEKDAIEASSSLIRLDSYRPVRGAYFLNSSEAVGTIKHKSLSRVLLDREDDPLTPRTWDEHGEPTFPCVIRPSFHSQGRDFFYCSSPAAYAAAEAALIARQLDFYASAYIPKRREFRVHIVGGYAVGMAEKFPSDPSSHVWNFHAGGRAVNLKRREWPLDAVRKALAAANILEMDMGAADVIEGEDGTFYVLELNTAPGIRNPRTLGRIAEAIKWQYGSEGDINESDDAESAPEVPWLTYLHPALR